MWIGREIDRWEWNVTKQTSSSSFVESKDTQLPDDMDSTFWYSTVDFSSFTLDLQTDFAIRGADQSSNLTTEFEMILTQFLMD